MNIRCSFVSGVKELAAGINESEAYTRNLVSAWQTKNGTSQKPTVQDLKSFIAENAKEKNEIYFAIPNYNILEFNPEAPLIEYKNGAINMHYLPEYTPMNYFYKSIGADEELRGLIRTPTDAYRWMLWKQMAILQNALNPQDDADVQEAEDEATEKMRNWRKLNPIKDIDSKIQPFYGKWSRFSAANDPTTLYIFTDNTSRDSGSGNIPANSWYAQTYGEGLHFPTMTSAVVRGLSNARPISTQRYYKKGVDYVENRWNDGHAEEFEKVISKEIDDIIEEWNTGEYDKIVLPGGDDGLFNAKISAISKQRTPKLYRILDKHLKRLREVVDGKKETSTPSTNTTQKEQKEVRQKNIDKTPYPPAMQKTIDQLNNWIVWQKQHIAFDKASHTYFLDGKPIDYTVTKYAEQVYGEKNIEGDYYFTQEIGNLVDAIVRDFFNETEDPYSKSYPNADDARKQQILKDCERLKKFFDTKYGEGKYKVITSDFPLAAFMNTSEGEKSIAGTMDMLVITEDGWGDIYDMKAKNHGIDDILWNGDPRTDRRDYTHQQNSYRQIVGTCIPALNGRIKSVNLLWFRQSYPSQTIKRSNGKTTGEAHYVVDEKGNITVTDKEVKEPIPIEKYYKWKTPHLNDNIEESIIPLSFTTPLNGVRPINSEINKEVPEEVETNAQDDDYNFDGLDETMSAAGEEIEDVNALLNLPSTEDPGNVVTRSFQPAQKTVNTPQENQNEEKVKTTTKVITEEDKNNVYKVPEVGVDNLQPVETPMSKMIREIHPLHINDRIEDIARKFADVLATKHQELVDVNSAELTEELQKPEAEQDIDKILALGRKAQALDNADTGRKAALLDIGFENIVTLVKNDYSEMLGISDNYAAEEYRKIIDNFDVLLKLSLPLIESRENIRISMTGNKGKVKDSQQDSDKDDEEFGDDDEGERVNGSEGWSFKIRLQDPVKTFTKNVKRVIDNIVRINDAGDFETDDLGNIKYFDSSYVVAVLLDQLSGMIDSDDFAYKDEDGNWQFPALTKASEKYPWIAQIIDALQEDPNLISAFYAGLRKDFISYWENGSVAIRDKEGKPTGKFKQGSFPLNKPIAFKSFKETIEKNYLQGYTFDEDSIYNSASKVQTDKGEIGKNLVEEVQDLLDNFDEDEWEEALTKATKAFRMLGMNIDKTTIQRLFNSDGGESLSRALETALSIFEELPKVDEDAYLLDVFNKEYNILSYELGQVSELDNVSSFRVGDKTYPSYAAPNYLDTLFKNLKRENDADRDRYLQNQFGQFEWFKKGGTWRSHWLELIDSDENVRFNIEMKDLNNIEGIEYVDWNDKQIKRAFIHEYFSVERDPGSKYQYAYYSFPIFSDSPVCKFIKFVKYTENFEEILLPKFVEIVKQEIDRMQLIKKRRAAGVSPITNFDTKENELKFHFFPKLNNWVMQNGAYAGKPFLQALTEIREKTNSDNELEDLYTQAISEVLNNNFENFYGAMSESPSTMNEIEEILINEKVIGSQHDAEDIKNALKEYYWNQAYATSQIIQLTVTDLAYYKNDTDFQKRFKELYAAGIKPFTNSEFGKKIETSIYLKDVISTSRSYTGLKRSLNYAVEKGRLQNFDRDDILDKFKEINETDAQAFRSLPSMRTILDMLGMWTPKMEKAIANFENDVWDMSDFNLVWQTIKPFMYTQIPIPDGLGSVMKVCHQNKNSEFLLLAMYNMIANSTRNSGVISGINKFMVNNGIDVIQFESAVKCGCQGVIDISYSQTKLDTYKEKNAEDYAKIMQAARKELGEEKFNGKSEIERFKVGNDVLLDKEEITQKEYNNRIYSVEPDEEEVIKILEEHAKIQENESEDAAKGVHGFITNDDGTFKLDNNGNKIPRKVGDFKQEVVHEIPYSDYMIAQPTPEHLFDVEAVFGSQFRNLIIADLPNDPDFRLTIHGKNYTKSEIINLYQTIITENLLEDYNGSEDKKGLKGKFNDIHTLQKAILDVVEGNPKYGIDMINALQIVKITDPRTGIEKEVFNIPFDSPYMFNKMQEVLMSMFKNAITKQHIKGGACILVSNVSKTKELHVLRDEKDGRLIGVECYLPAYSKKFYEPFLVTKTTEDGKEYQELDVEKMPKSLRKAIGYRIPTEDKYSMAPLIIKGFLPQQNGSSIMLPADITTIAGSDFDVDKLFIMLPEFYVIKYDKKRALDDYNNASNIMKLLGITLPEATNEDADITSEKIFDEVTMQDSDFKKWWAENKEQYKYDTPIVKKINYNSKRQPSEQSRAARNNMLIDISRAILTHKDMSDKFNNPGSFDTAKVAARIATITDSPELLEAFRADKGLKDKYEVGQYLLKLSNEGNLGELDKFLKKYKVTRSQLDSLNTFLYNHKQNTTGGKLIGVYAINTVTQAKYQHTRLAIKDDYTFIMNGYKIQSLHDTYSQRGERISKNCANFSAASVDNVKDPVLADLFQNLETANITGCLLRAGLSIQEVGLLFTQPIIKKIFKSTGTINKGFVEEEIKAVKNIITELGGIVPSDYKKFNYTSEMMMEVIIDNLELLNSEDIQNIIEEAQGDEEMAKVKADYIKKYKNALAILELWSNILDIASDVNELTNVTKVDSTSGVKAITLAGSKIMTTRVDTVRRKAKAKNDKFNKYTLTGVTDTIQNDFITPDMSIDEMRTALQKSSLPMLQAFYSLGVEFRTKLTKDYFSVTTPYAEKMTNDLFLNTRRNLNEDIVNLFYKCFLEYGMSSNALFGDSEEGTLEEKRDYYLYDYPAEYLRVINAPENKDIANLSIFKRITVTNKSGRGQITIKRSSGIGEELRNIFMRELDSLMFSDNPNAQKLLIDLFMYSFYKDGLFFGPESVGNFFSSNLMAALPAFINPLRLLKDNINEDSYKNFMDQFYANFAFEIVDPFGKPILLPTVERKTNMYGQENIISLMDKSGKPDGRISVSSFYVKNKKIDSSNKEGRSDYFPYIITNAGNGVKIYKLINPGRETCIYTEMPDIKTEQKFAFGKAKLNPNLSVYDLASINTDPERLKKNSVLGIKRPYFSLDTIEDYYDSLGGAEQYMDQLEKYAEVYAGVDMDGLEGLGYDEDTIEQATNYLDSMDEDSLNALESLDNYSSSSDPNIWKYPC